MTVEEYLNNPNTKVKDDYKQKETEFKTYPQKMSQLNQIVKEINSLNENEENKFKDLINETSRLLFKDSKPYFVESLDKTTIENTHLMASAEHYERAADVLAAVAKEISGLSIPEETTRKWKILFSSMRIVDDKLDHISKVEERLKFRQQIIDSLKGNSVDFSNDKDLEKAMLGIGDLAADLNDPQKQSFVNSLTDILQVTEKIKTEEV